MCLGLKRESVCYLFVLHIVFLFHLSLCVCIFVIVEFVNVRVYVCVCLFVLQTFTHIVLPLGVLCIRSQLQLVSAFLR